MNNEAINKKEEIVNKDLISSVNGNIITNNENKTLVINPISFELIQKVDLRFLLNTNIFGSRGSVITIHELSNENLGILLDEKLIIITHKTFKTIKIIEPNYNEIHSSKEITGNRFVDFIELKNCDIVIWTSNVILIYNKEYNLIQRIDEVEQGNLCIREDSDYDHVTYYDINSIYEMKNGKLVSCNSYGLKFYEKDKDKYNLISTEKMEIDVHFILEIKPNILILLQKHYDESFSDMEGDDKFLISIYNIENKSLIKVFRTRVESSFGEFERINYILNKKYLFMCYDKTMKIFNLENNMEDIYIENDDIYEYEEIFGEYHRNIKKEKRIKILLANYSDTLFFGKDNKSNLNMYIFNNKMLKIYYNFKTENIKGVIKLKNNDFIFYSYDCELNRFTPIFK